MSLGEVAHKDSFVGRLHSIRCPSIKTNMTGGYVLPELETAPVGSAVRHFEQTPPSWTTSRRQKGQAIFGGFFGRNDLDTPLFLQGCKTYSV